MTDWENVAKTLEKKWKSKIKECEHLEKVLAQTASNLAKAKYTIEELMEEE